MSKSTNTNLVTITMIANIARLVLLFKRNQDEMLRVNS